jgi:hypothetical protein
MPLTLPDAEGAIAEAAYACDTLKADGVVLLANVRGSYLGDATIAPLLAFVDPACITYGSDWPSVPKPRSLHFTMPLDECALDDAQRQAIDCGNAQKLLARLA